MTSICITPSLDCHLAPKCERHFRDHPDAIHADPHARYMVNLGDNAMFACPSYREREAIANVAKTMGPDRDIDADIAEIFGYVPPECEDGPELCGVPATWAGG